MLVGEFFWELIGKTELKLVLHATGFQAASIAATVMCIDVYLLVLD